MRFFYLGSIGLLFFYGGCKTSTDNLKVTTVTKSDFSPTNENNIPLPSHQILNYQYAHMGTQVMNLEMSTLQPVSNWNSLTEERAYWTSQFERLESINAKKSSVEKLKAMQVSFASQWATATPSFYMTKILASPYGNTESINSAPIKGLFVTDGSGFVRFQQENTYNSNNAYVLATLLNDVTPIPADQWIAKVEGDRGLYHTVVLTSQGYQGFFSQHEKTTLMMFTDAPSYMGRNFSTPLRLASQSGLATLPGSFVDGLASAAQNLWTNQGGIVDQLTAMAKSGDSIWFGGIGAGAAMSMMMGAYYAQLGGTAVVYAFGAPRFANQLLAEWGNGGNIKGLWIYLIESQEDPRRFYPPSAKTDDIFATYVDPLVVGQ